MAEEVVALQLLLESSSSSSDEEIQALIVQRLKTKRPKIRNYIEIINEYSDDERHFRLRRSTYEKLKELYESSAFLHTGISSDQALLGFLWFAGNKTCIRDVASRFNMAEATFHANCTNVMDFLNDLAKSIIQFPQTVEEKRNISTEFESINGFPGIVGCIDGTYIPIRTPAHKIKSTYVNRHDTPSLTLQAICDAKKRFLDVFTGVPSKTHDARIFSLSFISNILPEACGDEWHILGDSAYPLRKYLITPYRDYGNLTEMQTRFNHKFSACRVKIENAFALLKVRFRQLHRLDFNTVARSCNFIIACCTLHNLCIQCEDNFDYVVEEIVNNDDNFEEDRNQNRLDGEEKRGVLCELLQ